MLKFLKSLFGKRELAEPDTISEENLKGEETPEEEDPRLEAAIELSLRPELADRVSDMQKNFMREELAKLPPVKEGDISINGAYVVPSGDRVEVGFYIRSGLPRPVRFDSMPLVITNLKNEVLARRVFSMSELGEIPAHSARPGEVFFDRNDMFVDEIDNEDWKLAFDLQSKRQEPVKMTLEGLPEQLTEEQQKYLENVLEKLPPLKPGELNISALQAKVQEDGKLLATVLIRNGGKRPVKLEKLPLAVKDAQGREAATGLFNIENLAVKPNKARLWTFAFPPETILVDDLDLSRWSIYLKK